MITSGEAIPSVPIRLIDAAGISETTSDVVLGDGLVVMFAVPGAFTPTCHVNHLPGFLANAPKLKAKGVRRIVCATVNDHHVVRTWAEASGALGIVDFIADPKAELARALGLENDFPDLGTRYARSAMLIEDGRVIDLFLQTETGVTTTGAPAILMALEVRGPSV